MDEVGIWRSARQLLTEYGDGAEMEAALRVDEALAHGNMEGVRDWRSVLEAVKALHGNTRPKDAPLH